jgi:hypothetical protein
MTDLLIILFLAAMAVGWSLYLVVHVVISVSDYFFWRRIKAEEARRALEEKKRQATMSRDYGNYRDYRTYLGQPRLDEDGNPEFYPPVH